MNENQELPVQNKEKPLTRRALKKNYRRKFDEVRQESEIDPLTSLPTRRAYERRIKDEADRVNRFGVTTTLIYMDADKLKLINDSKGHQAGDEYLKSIADALRAGTRRDTDFIARMGTGGDEFVLILPNTNLDGAETLWNDSLNPEFEKRNISISGGAAEIDPQNPLFTQQKADSAMYGAKHDRERNGENLLFLYVDKKNG